MLSKGGEVAERTNAAATKAVMPVLDGSLSSANSWMKPAW
jgi:hypothetical protein